MTIACLGWGSLIWDPRDLPLGTPWRTDGPAVPVEFARESADGRMTLVIVEGAEPMPVLWAELDVESLDEAQNALARREGISSAYVHKSVGMWSPSGSSGHNEATRIGIWAASVGMSGVVWTALKPKFHGKSIRPSCAQVVTYLSQLEGEKRQLAEEYVRRAPAQIQTPYRSKIEHELRWTLL